MRKLRDEVMNFNVYDILRFRVLGSNWKCIQYLSRNYSFFKTRFSVDSDLDLIISNFIPENSQCYVINRKYYIKEDYIFWEDRYKIVRWKICLKGIHGGKTLAFLNTGKLGITILLDYFIEPLLGFKLARKGFCLLHSSGIAIDGKAIIFPAHVGVGKTSTILRLRGKGIFLGNEKVLLSDKGVVYGFPTPIHIYDYNVEDNPCIYRSLKLREQLELKIKKLIKSFSQGYASFPLEVDPERFWEVKKEKFPLQAVFLLTKTNKDRVIIKEISNREELSTRLLLIVRHEMRYLWECLQAYSYIYPEVNLEDFWQRMRKNILSALRQTLCYEVEIPWRYDQQVFEKIYALMMKSLNI